jgi:NADP-dependent 3-hydroxy acid dehydrogenase YdfG
LDLQGKTAIVTGASSGIGEAVAKELSNAGMNLIITARRNDRIQRLASTLDQTVAIPGDITHPDLSGKLIERALQAFGRCDVVVNNAGIWEAGKIEEINIERVCQMVRVNVEAAFRVMYTAVKYFRSVNQGYLIVISSVAGTKLVRPTSGAYAGTKCALEALSEGLRIELAGTPIKVSCIQPGAVITELQAHVAVNPRELYQLEHPLVPEDIARYVRFLLEQPDEIVIPRLMVLPKGQPI